MTNEEKTKRIARNTIFLYIRTFVLLVVSLYTSRILLQSLGVEDYGVYNVVGGFVGMFSIAVGPISSSISRFLTFQLGKDDIDKLKTTFSTSVNVQIGFSLILLIIGESFGVWFLNYKLHIPEDSMVAANWVLQCSLMSMVMSLINVPYFASIVAHERMDTFAYMSILEVALKLFLTLSLLIISFNRLIFYSIGIVVIGFIMRTIYGVYCTRKFEECHYEFKFDKLLFKDISGFAWWSFLGNTAYTFNTQGVSILMNLFFGVVLNAAKGIAMQVESAIMTFINSFTTAFNPQIIKSYAEDDKKYMFTLMCRGSKFSYFLFLLLIIPIEFEANTILNIWLGDVPNYSVSFLRLSLISTASMMVGNPFMQGIMASGQIRNYQIAVSLFAILIFPSTWIAYKIGLSPESYYWVCIITYNILIWIRMWFVKRILDFNIGTFVSDVFVPIVYCTVLSLIPPFIIYFLMPDSILRFIVLSFVSVITTIIVSLAVGMTKGERTFILNKARGLLKV